MQDAPFLHMKDIVKTFGTVRANDHVTLTVEKGTVHALLGENGAGKSTLMKILYGLYRPDSGDIFLRGRKVEISSPRNAIDLGIGMIHQHFMLIPSFTVLENVILGLPLSPHVARRKVEETYEQFGLSIDLDARVEDLAVGAQQRTEILKALFRGADLLIMDEPTSVLTPQESDDLFRMIRQFVRQGCTIVFITHKLNEVMDICDRITVLRDGRAVATLDRKESELRLLSRLMVGREVFLDIRKKPKEPGEPVLTIEDLCLKEKAGKPRLDNVNLKIRAGEIVGIAGVDGNGQQELVDCIIGVRRPTSGRVLFYETDIVTASTKDLIRKGLAHIPANRITQGLVLNFSIEENLITETYDEPHFRRRGLLDHGAVRKYAEQVIADYDVRALGPQIKVSHLSGGNQQKVVVGRELSRSPSFILAVQPTWGLDVGACEYVREQLLRRRDEGAAILLISTDLEEVRALSDKIAVIFEGRIMACLDPEVATLEEIGLLMAGGGNTI